MAIFGITLFSCNKDNNTTNPITISPGNDPNFTIVTHTDPGFIATNKKVDVFGIPIYAY